MNGKDRPRFAKGVRFRRRRDDTPILLVPEGFLALNSSAGATLELVDGTRTVADIVALIVEHYDVDEERAGFEVCELLDKLVDRCLIEAS